jgi:hypothetical protein
VWNLKATQTDEVTYHGWTNHTAITTIYELLLICWNTYEFKKSRRIVTAHGLRNSDIGLSLLFGELMYEHVEMRYTKNGLFTAGDGITIVDSRDGPPQVAWRSETRREAGSDPKWPRVPSCRAPPHELRVKVALEGHQPGCHCSRCYPSHNGRSY